HLLPAKLISRLYLAESALTIHVYAFQVKYLQKTKAGHFYPTFNNKYSLVSFSDTGFSSDNDQA
ncbi:MAG: hypothetical protein M3Z49_12615, partial [Bifidobacteriales bacterium]|nr:hypothetical protein [Bifidobacteriales bacterium]